MRNFCIQVMNLLEEGYKPDYIEEPPAVQLRNNRSAIEDLPTCRQHIVKWLSEGVIEQVQWKPRITNALSLVKKMNPITQVVKSRLCLDPSRSLNCFLQTPTVKLEDLRCFLPR